ncbi:MAG: GGDEF domain-containing protein [Alphaproteobacteria bacterium]
MSSNDGNAAFTAASASKLYNMTAFAIVLLVLGAVGLQQHTLDQEKSLAQTTALARHESVLVQRLAVLVFHYRATLEESVIKTLAATNAEAFTTHESVAAAVLPAMQGPSGDAATMTANGLDKTMRGYIEKSFGFAAAPQTESASAFAEEITKGALGDVAQKWNDATNAYIERELKKVTLYTRIGFGMLALALILLGVEAMMIVAPAIRYIVQLREHIDHMAATDQLTGFYNRAMLFKVAAMLMSGAKRHKQEVAAIAVSLDDFKHLTDTHGRAAGEAAIKALAGVLREVLRNSDVMGRVSGEEFAVFLPATNEYRAAYVAEKVRAAVEELSFKVKDNMVELRVCAGVGELQAHHKTPDDLLRAAEAGYKHALESGGNRVSTHTASKSGAPAPAPGTAGAAGASAAPVAAPAAG